MSRKWNNVRVRPAIFHAVARETVQEFPRDVKRALGKWIWDLQLGKKLKMPVSRAMPSVAKGVEELRVKEASGAYRVFYYVRSMHGVLVFHAFQKKSQQTPDPEIKLGQRRLKELLDELDENE